MVSIRIAIVDEQPMVSRGIIAMLADVREIEIVHCSRQTAQAIEHLSQQSANIAILILYRPDPDYVEQTKILCGRFPKTAVLIITLFPVSNFIFSLIRAGAKGHLTGETDREELIEALFSLRHGYDFISKTISNKVLMDFLAEKSNPAEGHNLSSRELEVLKLFAEGLTNSEIAEKLYISIRTVETHKNNIMRKLNLRTTVDMLKFALRNNLAGL